MESTLYGDASKIRGDASRIWGDCSRILEMFQISKEM
jgi:hypothetical protein